MKISINFNLICFGFLSVLPLALAAPASSANALAAELDVTVTAPGPTITVAASTATVTAVATSTATIFTVGIEDKQCGKQYSVRLPTGVIIVKTVDTCVTPHQRTCPREAMVALAMWRAACEKSTDKFRPECQTKAPSIEMCCTVWVPNDKAIYEFYGKYHERLNTTHNFYTETWDPEVGQWIKLFNGPEETYVKDVNGVPTQFIHLILPGKGDYDLTQKPCQRFQAPDEPTYLAFHQSLGHYGLADCNEKGEVWSKDGKTLLGYLP
ncbi:hypothetical protein LTR84_006007 [Exophiala bonariae]|uniref:Uncharacterized protein n=1 Tax=Exophiala bonariae TaxID=1690606 RepID=A0AAV9N2K4_9EURO|nr:hypothetical protein LTR84_006007 [Exophiala bonariae]